MLAPLRGDLRLSLMNERIDYTTHILIGIKKSGDMTVLAKWPGVPRQADVDGKIQSAGGRMPRLFSARQHQS